MTAIELLALLNEQGITLSVDGTDLRISAPKGGLTPELRDQLVRHKSELISLLAAPAGDVDDGGIQSFAGTLDQDALPLSFAQERLWFLDQLEPGSTLYNVPSALRLHGIPDTAALAEALRLVTERHQALRCRYATRGRDPVAILQPAAPVAITAHDCRDADPDALQAQLTELNNQPFDLMAGPVFRAHLLQTDFDEYILLFVVHHIATDGASAGIVMREWAALYGELTGGTQAELAELRVSYAEYAAWQRDHLAGPALEQELDYWREQLRGAPLQLDLPADKSRPQNPAREGGWVMELLPLKLLEQLRGVARAHQSTLYMVLLAAFNLLLYRYSRQDDILIGTPVAGRSRTETEGLVGLFVNSVVIRSRFSEDQTFADLLAEVNTASLDAINHQELPFEKLVEELQPERNTAVAPLFQVMFNLQNREHETVPFADIATSPVVVETGTAKFDLSVLMEDRSDGLAAWFEYSKDLYNADSIERMLGHYRKLLASIVAQPSAKLAELSLLEDDERQQLNEWNATAADYPDDATLVSLFEAQVAATPDSAAVTFGGETLSYAQLNARANKLARYLKQHGVMRESLVGVCMERSLDMVVALYGILKAGGAYVPLDPDYPQQRLAHMLEDARITVILSQSHLSDRLPKSNASIVNTNIGWDAIQISYCAADNPALIAQADNAAYVIFTSGSTGRPKGVLNEHRGIVNRLLWMQDEYGLDADDRVLQKTPYSFDVSVWEFFLPLLTGAELIVAEPGGHKDTTYLTGVIREYGITTLHFVPSMLRSFLDDPDAGECTSLQRVICSGEALPADLQNRFFAMLNTGLHNLYGPTEAAIDVTYWPCERDRGQTNVPIGRPVANTQIYIVDTAGHPCPPGIPGELLIGGVQVARGYVNRPELTDERFIADYLSGADGMRLYRTGDLARFRGDGVIEFLGRIDFQVKLRGFRIELGEIETALQQCDGVAQVAVLLREDEPGDQRLAAYYVSSRDHVSAEALRAQAAESLPDYMIPAAFIALDELPLTASGKLDRNALPAPDWSSVAAVDYVPPRTPEEEALCEIWADLLNVARVGIHDDFFRIGGHSLLAARVVARIRDTLRKELTLKALFDHPTVAELSTTMQDADEVSGEPLQPRDAGTPVPLSASQQRLWILDQLDPGNCAYNIPWATRLRGELNVNALQSAINKLADRHATLRTAFVAGGKQPLQQVSDSVELPLHMLSCSEADLQRELTRLTQHSFALDQAPLVRITLLRLAADDHVLHINMHHIIGDAWSTDVFRRELSALYNAELQNTDAALPELPVQFADYAVWQAERLQSAAIQDSVSYWTGQLADAPAVLNLPTDRPRPAVQTYNGAWQELRIPRELTTALKRLANERDVTLYMLLLTAFDVLLNRYTGQDDIVIGTPVAGRQQGALENLIGFFINTLALRTRIPEDTTFAGLLAQVKDTALDAYAQQELPFEQLVEEIQPVRDTSYAPIFQVMFILQNAPDTVTGFAGLDAEPVLFSFGTAKLDLTLSMEERNGELIAYFEYNTDLFDPETVAQMGGHFAGLLEQATEQPDAALTSIDLLSDDERRQIIDDVNKTGRPYPDDQPIHELFMQQAAATPDAIAVECAGEQLSYADLDARSNALAMQLVRLGAGPGVPIALCLHRTTELPVALLAILKAGSAYVPLDPEFPADRLTYMLEDSAAPVLVTESSLAGVADGLDITTLCLDRQKPEHSLAAPAVDSSTTELAYVIYTSGSTGKPKGVAIEHRAAVNFLCSMIREPGINANDRWLAVTTLSFDISILEIFGPLLAGATVVLATRDTVIDGFALARTLENDDISVMQATPATWRMLLQTGWRGGEQLKMLCGGESLDAELARELAGCGAELWNMYGPTETTIWSTCERIHADVETVTVGRPIANTRCYVLDEQLNPVPPGVAGELFIGGDGVAREYLNRPQLTAEKFIADPFVADPTAASGRMYSTGDLARLRRDGRLDILGRVDFQVKLRGFRIELGEIEAAAATLDGIDQCVTVLREDSPGDQRLVAYYTTDGAAPDHEALRSCLRERLPEYMVPAAFIELDSFPLTPNAKVDRNQLPAPVWQAQQEYVAPRTELEETLATIWREVLDVDQVGIYDDFFALGGHSLLATRLISRILDDTGLELPFMTLFNQPTIDGLSRALEGRNATGSRSLTRLPRDGKLPLSFAQQRLWFLDELSPGDPMYNIPWVMGLHGEPDSAALQTAIDGVIARHESLRTIFPNHDGEPQQVILPELPVTLAEEDLRDRSEAEIQARLTELAQQRMSIASGPLTCITLLRT
ncbi:MAG: amino acid adenylation domain-containing protein, partial [Gammaproteobacteria bacterium]|nr:amino acid adenylation domain-containing protein [Gammaproteobacteria bacterium]